MNTAVPNLNVLDALKNSIPFCFEFAKKHWIVASLMAAFFFLNSLFTNWMSSVLRSEAVLSNHFDPFTVIKTMFDARFVLPYVLLTILGSVAGYLLCYYAIRMAVGQLSPSIVLASKSLLKSLWQLFCMSLVIGIVAIPLFALLIIPWIWWLTKTSVAPCQSGAQSFARL